VLKLLEPNAGEHRRGSATIASPVFNALLIRWRIPFFHLSDDNDAGCTAIPHLTLKEHGTMCGRGYVDKGKA
jgi:hypothetical protein